MSFDRFDVCEAYAVLEWEYNRGGWLRERPSNQRRMESTGVQLHRLRFRPRPSLGGFETLTANGRVIYRVLVDRYGFQAMHAQGIVAACRELDAAAR